MLDDKTSWIGDISPYLVTLGLEYQAKAFLVLIILIKNY
jgi:hypothetical protein